MTEPEPAVEPVILSAPAPDEIDVSPAAEPEPAAPEPAEAATPDVPAVTPYESVADEAATPGSLLPEGAYLTVE